MATTGQANLLVTKRFKQYGELCDLSKDKEAELSAGSSDLEGFWEVIKIQVCVFVSVCLCVRVCLSLSLSLSLSLCCLRAPPPSVGTEAVRGAV